ncbi:hypothetical protein ABIB25_005584 [Nakamurella sp. UYEF19]|uniref:helicase C-terminal domain-containing protein n=1 Tax=Nakamurella sp. UYEF19 TaxID=1756392 RepID=UPI003393263A
MSPERFEAEPILAGLKNFQRDTVEHVVGRMYGKNPTRRFLVADETGLGKSLVARGVIARTIEKLQDDPTVDRIDIVYVCSNLDLARQNIGRMRVTGDRAQTLTSRLTMLATNMQYLRENDGRFLKPIKLISFTPGTSFNKGQSTGLVQERALLMLLLDQALDLRGARQTAAQRLLQGGVKLRERFADEVSMLKGQLTTGIDEAISVPFLTEIKKPIAGAAPLLKQFEMLLEDTIGRSALSKSASEQIPGIISRMRNVLARVSVDSLEPDLVILDEFQRFRELLDPGTEAGEMADQLFSHRDARVLLLSATPYKPFTYAEEAAAGENHRADFLKTIDFLCQGCPTTSTADIASSLDSFRESMISGDLSPVLVDGLQDKLLTVMSRAERPELTGITHIREVITEAGPIQPAEIVDFVRIQELAEGVDSQAPVEYWKSSPYFINFMDGYQIRDKVLAGLDNPRESLRIGALLDQQRSLDAGEITNFEQVDFGNARLRALAKDTVGAGWEQLLWMPASLPYLRASGPYAGPEMADITKRLVFSSWTATPTAVSALLSYEADRKISALSDRLELNTPEARRRIATRLTYRVDAGRPASMTSLALFWPMPGLAELGDPWGYAKRFGVALDENSVVSDLAGRLSASLPTGDTSNASASDLWYWTRSVGRSDSFPGRLDVLRQADLVAALGGSQRDPDAEDDSTALAAHVALAFTATDAPPDRTACPPDLAEVLARLALFSPANCAWRALGRLAGTDGPVTDLGRWKAAAVLASGLRSLFSRWESIVLLDFLYPEAKIPYWQKVLLYCAAGNLQSVLDEYLFHLMPAEGTGVIDDASLFTLASAAVSALSLRSAAYQAFDPTSPETRIPFQARFAVRYGSGRQEEKNARPAEVRGAFNSPFWPFVLTSTSVGQEGIDFHWWCHHLVHWNVPANPVDFEQREGRVNRYRGHALRKNVVAAHHRRILADRSESPWASAYRIAAEDIDLQGGLVPDWMYPGDAAVVRQLMPFPLSSDIGKLRRIKRDLALYRMTFGQARQEDLVELLAMTSSNGQVDKLRLDLRAPSRGEPVGGGSG